MSHSASSRLSTRLLGTLGLLLGCASTLTVTACDDAEASGDKAKKADSSAEVAKDGAAGAGAAEAAAKVKLAARSLDLPDGFKVDMQTPDGWTEQKLGGGVMLSKPGKGMFQSSLTVNSSCEGNCASIPENLQNMASQQIEMHKGYYPTAKVALEGEVSGGGREFQLDLAKADGRKAVQYKIVRFEDGWASGVQCTAMLLEDDVALVDELKAACNSMKITAKAG